MVAFTTFTSAFQSLDAAAEGGKGFGEAWGGEAEKGEEEEAAAEAAITKDLAVKWGLLKDGRQSTHPHQQHQQHQRNQRNQRIGPMGMLGVLARAAEAASVKFTGSGRNDNSAVGSSSSGGGGGGGAGGVSSGGGDRDSLGKAWLDWTCASRKVFFNVQGITERMAEMVGNRDEEGNISTTLNALSFTPRQRR